MFERWPRNFCDQLEQQPLLFHHIPKTGGTSLGEALVRQLPPNAVSAAFDDVTLGEACHCEARPRFYQGHFTLANSLAYVPSAARIACFRDPIRRALSQILNWRDAGRIQEKWLTSQWASDLTDTLRTMADQGVTQFFECGDPLVVSGCSNILTRFCLLEELSPESVAPDFFDARLVERAIENIDLYFSWVGVLERLDESLELLSDLLAMPRLELDTKNKSEAYTPTGAELASLEQHNRLDLVLYPLIRARHDDRYRAYLGSADRRLWSRLADAFERRAVRAADGGAAYSLFPDDPFFSAGWHYLERAGKQMFRWGGLRGATSQLLLPLAAPPRAVRLWTENDLGALKQDDIRIAVNGVPLTRAATAAAGDAIVIDYVADAGKRHGHEALPRLSSLEISAPVTFVGGAAGRPITIAVQRVDIRV